MKKTAFLFISLLCGSSALAWDFISSGGAATDEVAWSIGGYGTATLTSADGQFILTQGFLQPATFLPSGVQTIEQEQLRVYPNPVVDRLSVQSEQTLTGWTLYDATGKVIAQRTITPAQHTELDFSTYPQGCYALDLHGAQGHTIVKVIK